MNWKIDGLATAGVYVDDYGKALEFYRSELGFEKKSDMSESSCWGKIGELGLFIQGFSTFFDRMKELGATLDEKPIPLNGMNMSFFRFKDPAGNVLEAAGA
jgi:hypothetical protein